MKRLTPTTKMRSSTLVLKASCLVFLALFAAGCRQDMADLQPRYQPLQKTEFFEDHQASRLPVTGTVAYGRSFTKADPDFLREDRHLYEGKAADGLFAQTFPFEITKADLDRGQQRFEAYCSMCHNYRGDGNGMIVRRGLTKPNSFHQDDVRRKPVGYYYSVISNGFGSMGSYAASISVRDRWRIVAYIRALQYSQNVPVAEVPAEKRSELDKKADAKSTGGQSTGGHQAGGGH